MIYLIDSGHGGMIGGEYQTAPRKMYEFPDNIIAYEGVINRQIKDIVLSKLKGRGFKYIDVCPTEIDLPLEIRVKVINEYAEKYRPNNCLVISLHSNAGGGTGFEIWTSPGQTKSDRYADMFGETFQAMFPDIRFRKNTSDGDLDKESAFYILQKTNCPAILPEFMFFDNWEDFKILRDPNKQEEYATMILEFVKRAEITVV